MKKKNNTGELAEFHDASRFMTTTSGIDVSFLFCFPVRLRFRKSQALYQLRTRARNSSSSEGTKKTKY